MKKEIAKKCCEHGETLPRKCFCHVKLKCPRIDQYGVCQVKGCGYCDRHHKLHQYPMPDTLEKQRCEKCGFLLKNTR